MIKWIFFFAKSDFFDYILLRMEKLRNIGDGDKRSCVTDGSVGFRKTLKILEKEYNLICVESIDKGSFGSVFEVRSRDKQERLAAKISFATKVSKGDKVIWPTLKHENLVPLLATYHLKDTDTYVFVMKKYEMALLKQMQDMSFEKILEDSGEPHPILKTWQMGCRIYTAVEYAMPI